MSAAEAFAAHALGLSAADAPASTRARAKAFLLDTLAVGIAGRAAPYAGLIRSAAAGWGVPQADGPGAEVLGGGLVLPAAGAAYVNGFQIHAQEYDCVHEPAVVHPMAVIGGALAAEIAVRPTDGETLLAAVIAGIDVAAGLGLAALSPIRFFRPATAGLFGATLAVARLRGLSHGAAMDALGYALAQAAGTMQAHVEGKPALPVQIAGAARAAVCACDLAERGLPGPHDVIEGDYGYLPLFETTSDVAVALDRLGARFAVDEVSYKPWPTGRAAQGGIAMMLRLRADGLEAGRLDAARLVAPPLIKRLVGRPAHGDMAANYARLCFPYLGALALRFGRVGLDHFSPQALGDPETLALAARITVIDDASPDPAAFAPQRLEARAGNGFCETRVTALYGSPADPMDEADVAAKRSACLAFGLGAARPELDAALCEAVAGLDAGRDGAGRLAGLAAGRA